MEVIGQKPGQKSPKLFINEKMRAKNITNILIQFQKDIDFGITYRIVIKILNYIQDVHIKEDSFPYGRYGTLQGTELSHTRYHFLDIFISVSIYRMFNRD